MKHFTLSFFIIAVLASGCKKVDKPEEDVDYNCAYVINGESNSISVIDLSSNTMTEECNFKVGSWPHHIYTNSSHDKLLISLVGADLSGGHAGHGAGEQAYLLMVENGNFKQIACYKSEHPAHNALFVNNDSEVWLPQMTSAGSILRLDSENLKENGSIEVGAGPLEITSDINGTYAFVCNGEGNSVSVIQTSSAEVVKTIPVGSEPVGAWPAANNKMYVDCEVSKQIFEIDVTTLLITDTIELDFTPAYVAYNNNTSQLWVSDATNGGVSIYNNVGGNWIELSFVATGANAHAIAFNKDYSKAYVTNQDANTVSVLDATSFTAVSTIPVGEKPNGILLIEN